MKALISENMRDPDGSILLLLGTKAFSMGADAAGVGSVQHLGPSNTMEGKILHSLVITFMVTMGLSSSYGS